MAPQHLQMNCEPASILTARHLRSAHSARLTVPHNRTNYGDRSITVQGPRVWNSLPAELRAPDIMLDMFRNKLKTLLFNAQLSTQSICSIVRPCVTKMYLIIIIIIVCVTDSSHFPADHSGNTGSDQWLCTRISRRLGPANFCSERWRQRAFVFISTYLGCHSAI